MIGEVSSYSKKLGQTRPPMAFSSLAPTLLPNIRATSQIATPFHAGQTGKRENFSILRTLRYECFKGWLLVPAKLFSEDVSTCFCKKAVVLSIFLLSFQSAQLLWPWSWNDSHLWANNKSWIHTGSQISKSFIFTPNMNMGKRLIPYLLFLGSRRSLKFVDEGLETTWC